MFNKNIFTKFETFKYKKNLVHTDLHIKDITFIVEKLHLTASKYIIVVYCVPLQYLTVLNVLNFGLPNRHSQPLKPLIYSSWDSYSDTNRVQ